MAEDKLPTTDNYKLGVDIDLSEAKSLSEEFMKASKEGRLEEVAPKFIRSVTGQDDINVDIREDMGVVDTEYGNFDKVLTLGTKDIGLNEKLSTIFDVDINNLPPNIPEKLTPEHVDLFVVLHEAEHATQNHVPRTEDGKLDPVNIVSNVVKPEAPITAFGDGKETILEVDADLAPVAYLRETGMDDAAQFFSDMREINFNKEHHDTSTIRDYYEETGKVIDPHQYEIETASLREKMTGKIGVDYDHLRDELKQYPPDVLEKIVQDSSFREVFDKIESEVTPQKLMYGSIKLLEEGEVEGVARLKVENYLAAMDRLGYTPDPKQIDCNSRVSDVMENINASMHPDEQPGSDLTAPVNSPLSSP